MNLVNFQIPVLKAREDRIYSSKFRYLELQFDVAGANIDARLADGTDIQLISLGPIVFWAKLIKNN